FDQEFGLVLHAPVYLLGIAGLVSLFRRSALLGALALLVLLSMLLPGAAHPLWSGGTSPPARFLFPALPLLMVAAATLVGHEREVGVGRWAPALLATSIGIALSMLLLPGGPFYLNARTGRGRIWEALSSSWDLTDYLPSLVRSDPRSLVVAAVLASLVAVAVGAQIRRLDRRLAAPGLLWVLGLWIQDLTGVSRSRRLEPRWVTETMHYIAENPSSSFVTLPSFELNSGRELSRRISLPLEGLPGDGDPRHWWSLSYEIPAGRYRVSGIPEKGVSFCNGERAFLSDEPLFATEVALARFRLRARGGIDSPRLHLLEPRGSHIRALATVPMSDEVRLHALEEGVYLDPEGFWVRKAARASFAIELLEGEESSGGKSSIAIANGGVQNRVRIDSAHTGENLELAPWEERRVEVVVDGTVAWFFISSEGGFRPSELDPGSRDHRELGVLVRARPPFD
ncbi:MAG: hypothetical protein ACRD21_16785, partial [Vicinamibacteria bacterium]